MLFIVDMQNDFIDQDNGKMAVKDANYLVPKIIEKIEKYEENKDLIFYTLNIHENMEDDCRSMEEKKWGQSLYPTIYTKLIHHHALKKINYGIPLEECIRIKNMLSQEKTKIKGIEIVGVETHICLLSNAIILQNLFPNTKIIINEKLCTSSDLTLHRKALSIMKELKMEVI